MRAPRAAALAAAASLVVLPAFGPAARSADPTLLGFTVESSAAQRALEARFDAQLRAENLRAWMKRLAARPHAVGQPYGKDNAEWLLAQFRSWGFDARIETFDVLFPTPKTRRLEMTAPTRFEARLAEPTLKEDATSGQTAEQLPIYHGYSIDGDVEAPLVYVNYGLPGDYEVLARHGIDVKGKIVIARYGASWRGIKPKVAAEHGAVGCLIYSDPRDDGYFQGDVYPKGPWRMEHGAQRGSVADMPLFPGDPLTPGVGATKDAKRLERKDAPTLTKIPVLPISYADAQPLLRALGGPVVPAEWRGDLPFTYHFGPGPARVRLTLEFDWKLAPAMNVIATLRGSALPDQWVLRGNHHDAWVNGAEDPVSGAVALMEEARAVAALAKEGRPPKRTLVYALWDAEEPGLLGSTEWVETHAEELRAKAVAYVNSDSNSRGFLYAGGSHTLEPFVDQVARDVTDPQTRVSVHERARAYVQVNGPAAAAQDLREHGVLRLQALGSGSDFTPFLQHLGVASLNVGFGGEADGGSYHSIYDSIDHYTRFMDPDFAYGVALAQVGGRIVLRLANADVLPLDAPALAHTVEGYAKEVQELADELRMKTDEENRKVRERVYELAADPTLSLVPPKAKDPVPYLAFAPLQNAVTRLVRSAEAFQKTADAQGLSDETRRTRNAALLGLERRLTRREGLPGRPWFTHQVYAPGFYTGYGVKTLPAIREAIEQRQWPEATAQIARVAETIDAFSAELERLTAAAPARPDPSGRRVETR